MYCPSPKFRSRPIQKKPESGIGKFDSLGRALLDAADEIPDGEELLTQLGNFLISYRSTGQASYQACFEGFESTDDSKTVVEPTSVCISATLPSHPSSTSFRLKAATARVLDIGSIKFVTSEGRTIMGRSDGSSVTFQTEDLGVSTFPLVFYYHT